MRPKTKRYEKYTNELIFVKHGPPKANHNSNCKNVGEFALDKKDVAHDPHRLASKIRMSTLFKIADFSTLTVYVTSL